MPFLYNAWGIEMAARTYFDKPAAKLTVLESGHPGGHAQGHQLLQPGAQPQRAVARRNTVLAQMVKREVLAGVEFERLESAPAAPEL